MDETAPAPEPSTPVAVEDNSPSVSATEQPTTSEPKETESPEPTPVETPAVEPKESERPEPRPAQRRIQQLVNENKQLKEQLSPASIPQVSPQIPKLSEMLAGRESIDPSELDQIGQRVYDQAAQTTRGLNNLDIQQLRQEMLQREAITDAERDASIIVKDYAELDPDSPSFNPVLEEKVVETYQKLAVKPDPLNPQRKVVDPSIKLTDVAKDLVELARASVEHGRNQSTAELARQADLSAVTPSSDAPAERSTDDMSLAEHEAYLIAKGYDLK